MLEFRTFREVEEKIRFPYYMFQYPPNRSLSPQDITTLKNWSDEVEMHMYYCGGSLYFNDEKDKTLFILRWM